MSSCRERGPAPNRSVFGTAPCSLDQFIESRPKKVAAAKDQNQLKDILSFLDNVEEQNVELNTNFAPSLEISNESTGHSSSRGGFIWDEWAEGSIDHEQPFFQDQQAERGGVRSNHPPAAPHSPESLTSSLSGSLGGISGAASPSRRSRGLPPPPAHTSRLPTGTAGAFKDVQSKVSRLKSLVYRYHVLRRDPVT